ncbi:MAG TPA: FmdE family protein [Acidimicrobiales bacterium]|nr:FmdE family protein [Acidimicrobiales bacterium]
MRQFTFDRSTVDEVVAFHGHMCGGMATGIKASELALRHVGPFTRDEDLTAVVETDMCAVDAIQVITGCSFGKGNLVHRDWGKNAYTFYNRPAGTAVRISPRPGVWEGTPERQELWRKRGLGTLTPEESVRFDEVQQEWTQYLLTTPAEELFFVAEVEGEPPVALRPQPTIPCQECGELVTEIRMRWLGGRQLCLGCFALGSKASSAS